MTVKPGVPEGPEIRIAADRIAAVLENQRIEQVQLLLPALRAFEPVLAGATVARVDTRGKAMLTRFDNGLTLYSHNQLYGRWYVRARGALPNTRRTLRVALHTQAHSALLYSASDIEVLDDAGLAEHRFLSRLGPDILGTELTPRRLEKRLGDPRFQRRSLASLYLDQAFVAGVGNYLRSEILFFAKLPIMRKPVELDAAQRRRLARETLAVARRSYASRGITNTPARVRERKASGDKTRRAFRFAVFDREGRPCDTCGTTIERAEAGSRRIYFCPSCQA